MRLSHIGSLFKRTYDNVQQKHTMQMAAELSYYFVMSLFPLLIVFAATVAYLPVPNLLDQAMALAAHFIPHDSVGLVQAVLRQVITPSRGKFLSFGILGTIWAASGGFSSMIEALNIAYDVREERPFWKTRPLAIGLTFLIGMLADNRFGAYACRPELRRLVGDEGRLGVCVRDALAVSALVHRGRVYGAGDRVNILSRAQRTPEVSKDSPWSCDSGCLLDSLILGAGSLLPALRQGKQNLWNPRRCHCSHGLALLDSVRGHLRGRDQR